MFSEVLKIIPKLEGRDLANLEKTLNGRFAKVAKKFGGGILNVLKGGGILGVATTLIDKILNPLQEVQQSIEKTLQTGDDLATYAKQFNTTAGNLARLQAFGKATGLDPEGVRLLLGKFQAAVATSAANPGEPSSVSAFVGRKDTAEAFFEFVQSMQKLNATQQNLVQQEVFGEKQILKASEFLNADFKKLDSIFNQAGAPSAAQQTAAAEFTGQLSDNLDTLRAIREQKDFVTKSRLINDNTIAGVNQGEAIDQARENKRLAQFDDLKKISIATDKMVKLLEDAYLKLAPVLATALPALVDQLVFSAKAVEKSRAIRGLIPGQGKDK